MKRFLGKLIGFCALQSAILGLLLWGYQEDRYGFCETIIAKHYLSETVSGSRIFFMGGSNVAYGIDSPLAAEQLPHRPINLALSALHGLDFMLMESLDVAREGDIIVLSLEYEHFFEDLTSVELIVRTASWRPEMLRNVGWTQARVILDQGLKFICDTVKHAAKRQRQGEVDAPKSPEEILAHQGFNIHGDFVGHHGKEPTFEFQPTRRTQFQENTAYVARAIEKLNQFARQCESRGVAVVLAYPPYERGYFEERKEQIAWLDKRLRQELAIPIINSPSEMAYESSHFFDTAYHLTAEGKQIRTRQLVEGLYTNLAIKSKQTETAIARRSNSSVKASVRSGKGSVNGDYITAK